MSIPQAMGETNGRLLPSITTRRGDAVTAFGGNESGATSHRSLTTGELPLKVSMLQRIHNHQGQERGSALVEMVLVLPILLLILFGIIDFGRAFNYWENIHQISGQGARFAVVNQDPGSGTLQAYIKSQADTAELRNGGGSAVPVAAQVCISFPSGTSNVGDPVKVSVSFTYYWMSFLFSKTNIASTTISASQTMRIEVAPTVYTAGCG